MPKGRISKGLLEKMPIVDTPFERVAIDVIGTLSPTLEKGNRYILTMVGFATRYPDAVPLTTIDTAKVAEGLMEMFSRVGLPRQILSDRGINFTSSLMKEINRLLSVQRLTTTPYHPICNGLVEKFNGTLKQMLRKMCQEKPRSWDTYLAPLLFAYREVPQTSLGFSPFELIYGRHVRGPLSVLNDIWTKEEGNEELRTTYGYVLDLRNRLEETMALAHEKLKKNFRCQKHIYDRNTRETTEGGRQGVAPVTYRTQVDVALEGPISSNGKKERSRLHDRSGTQQKSFSCEHVEVL